MVSIEVLAERIESYTRETVAESKQMRRDIAAVFEQLNRLAMKIADTDKKLDEHEKLPGHAIGIMRVSALESQVSNHAQELTSVQNILALERDITRIKVDIESLKQEQLREQAFLDGRKSALSMGEKAILLIIAMAGPAVGIADRIF